MYVNMIEDIVKAIKKEYGVHDIDVDYDFMPVSSDDVLSGINIVMDNEIGDWSATGEMWVIRSGISDRDHIQVILLKRGVEISFMMPQSSEQKVKEE